MAGTRSYIATPPLSQSCILFPADELTREGGQYAGIELEPAVPSAIRDAFKLPLMTFIDPLFMSIVDTLIPRLTPPWVKRLSFSY